jgi:hypothetical protein
VASSCLCPHRLLNAPSDLHRPHRRTKCATIPDGVCFQHLFLTIEPHSSIFIYLDGSHPPIIPLNFQSRTIGNLVVYGFAFSPFSSLHSLPDYAGAFVFLFLIGFQGRRNCDFSTNPGVNSCLDGGCNGGLLCDPHTGTVRLALQYSRTPNSHIRSVSPSLSTPPPGRRAGCTARNGGGMDASG